MDFNFVVQDKQEFNFPLFFMKVGKAQVMCS